MSEKPDSKFAPPGPETFESLSRRAPNFVVVSADVIQMQSEQMRQFIGPLAKAQVPVVELFDSNLPHQANQTVSNKSYMIKDGTQKRIGDLELHYGSSGQPESAQFTDERGNVETINVDKKNPNMIASDQYELKADGVKLNFTFNDHGTVARQSIVDLKTGAVAQSDIDSGFHYKASDADGSFSLSSDRNGKFITYAASEAARQEHKSDPTFVVGQRLEYNDRSITNGSVGAIEITRENGDSYRAQRGPTGAWRVVKEKPAAH